MSAKRNSSTPTNCVDTWRLTPLAAAQRLWRRRQPQLRPPAACPSSPFRWQFPTKRSMAKPSYERSVRTTYLRCSHLYFCRSNSKIDVILIFQYLSLYLSTRYIFTKFYLSILLIFPLFLQIYMFIYLYIFPSIYRTIYPSDFLSIYLYNYG